MSGYILVPKGEPQRVVHTAGRFYSPVDVVLAWDLTDVRPGSEPLDLHCDHCRSNVRGLSAPGRPGTVVVVEHDPACPWIRADPPFDPATEARRGLRRSTLPTCRPELALRTR